MTKENLTNSRLQPMLNINGALRLERNGRNFLSGTRSLVAVND